MQQSNHERQLNTNTLVGAGMALGKTIRIYLVDGEPTGIRMVDLSSWTGQALVCQRSQLASLAQRPEARRTGVYMLVGPDPEHAGKDRVYIGEGDSVFDRLSAH